MCLRIIVLAATVVATQASAQDRQKAITDAATLLSLGRLCATVKEIDMPLLKREASDLVTAAGYPRKVFDDMVSNIESDQDPIDKAEAENACTLLDRFQGQQ